MVIAFTDAQGNTVTQFGSTQSFTITREDVVVALKPPPKFPGPKAIMRGSVRVPSSEVKRSSLGKGTKISYIYQYGPSLDPSTWTNAPKSPRITMGNKSWLIKGFKVSHLPQDIVWAQMYGCAASPNKRLGRQHKIEPQLTVPSFHVTFPPINHTCVCMRDDRSPGSLVAPTTTSSRSPPNLAAPMGVSSTAPSAPSPFNGRRGE